MIQKNETENIGLQKSGYLISGVRRFDLGGAMLGAIGVSIALIAITGSVQIAQLFDPNSLVFILLGTISVTMFQYDLKSFFLAFGHLMFTFYGKQLRKMRKVSKELDRAIESGEKISQFSHDGHINGNLINDVCFFYDSGLNFDEVDEILASGIVTEFQLEKRSAELFFRASQLAPALGLLGTIIGLVGVLRSLGDPGQIGASMSLALMTTGYGAALGNLFLGPVSGRIDTYSDNLLLVQREIIRKFHILYLRSETDFNQKRKSIAA